METPVLALQLFSKSEIIPKLKGKKKRDSQKGSS